MTHPAASPVSLALDVVIDVVCPWCFVGKRRLDQAMAMAPEIDFAVRWRPFQLDPTLPRRGLDRKAYLAAKFGGPERLAAAERHLEGIGGPLGIAFDFAAITASPNTLDAHRVLRWAEEAGVQAELLERLYRAYFVEGENIGDPEVLAACAAAAGMNGAEVASWLATGEDRETVTAEIAEAQAMGITGVPCLIIERKYAVTGAQEARVLADAFRDIAEEKRFGAKA